MWWAMPAATLASGLLGAWGQDKTNEANAEQARLNREFQERMRNTEYQARINDLRAAGLNPALAYDKGGASSPSGSMPAPMQNAVGAASTSAMQALQMINETLRTNAQVQQIKSQTAGQDLQNLMLNTQKMLWGPKFEAEKNKAIADSETAKLLEEYNRRGLENLLRKLSGDADLAETNSALSSTQKKLLELQMNKGEVFSDLWGGAGAILNFFKSFITSAGKVR